MGLTHTHMSCPRCEGDVLVSGVVSGPDRYSLGDYGPPGCVFEDAPEVDDVTPTTCPYCRADIAAAAEDALFFRAEVERD